MRLENYIVEEEKGLAYYIPKIQAECKPFLKDIKGAAGTLFRDDIKNHNMPIWKKKVRKDRLPLDTPKHIHDELDNIFLKKFGWKARSEGLFCWPYTFKSPFVSYKWIVFPVGNYKYLWSKEVDDLWEYINTARIMKQDYVEYFEEILLETYTNKGIKMSIRYENEIMVKCDWAYLVKPELMEPVNEMLGLNWQGAKFTGRKI